MKILHIANKLNHSDGVSNHLYILLNQLRKKNTDVTLLCGGGNAIDKFRKSGLNVAVIRNLDHDNRSLKNYASAILKLNSLIRKYSFDIVHSHNHYAANIADRACKLKNVKTVQTIHGLIPEKGRLRHFIAGNYVAVSSHVQDHLKKMPGIKNKVILIQNGVEVRNASSAKIPRKLTFISASRLEKGKGTDTFIKAVSMLSEKTRNECEFVIAGTGSLEAGLKKLNKKKNAGVVFKGMIEDIIPVFERSDVFVMTSESEGLPMSVLEAGSMKNFIITSSYEGARDLIDDNSDGLIFKTGNESDLMRKMLMVIEDREFMNKASEKFRNKVKEKFSSEKMADNYIQLYKKIVTA